VPCTSYHEYFESKSNSEADGRWVVAVYLFWFEVFSSNWNVDWLDYSPSSMCVLVIIIILIFCNTTNYNIIIWVCNTVDIFSWPLGIWRISPLLFSPGEPSELALHLLSHLVATLIPCDRFRRLLNSHKNSPQTSSKPYQPFHPSIELWLAWDLTTPS